MSMNISNNKVLSAISALSFILLLYFSVFGTSLPFREAKGDEFGSSNFINQVSYSTIFILSLITIIPKIAIIGIFIRKEIFLTVFVLWCLLTIVWSEASFISFKRLFQVIAVILSCLSFFSYHNKDEALKYLRIILAIYLTVSLLSVFTIPGAREEYGAWRGLALQKNLLAQTALFSLILFSFNLKEDNHKQKILNLLLIIISVFLIIGSRSATAIIMFTLLCVIFVLIQVNKIFSPIGIRSTVSILIVSTLFFFMIIIVLIAPETIDSIFSEIGRDTTFTGRAPLWELVLSNAQNHPLIGCGFQGFWVDQSKGMLVLLSKYTALPNHAHNGYVDFINEIGLIGIALFLTMVLSYFIYVFRNGKFLIFNWIILIALVLNFQESVLFRAGVFTGNLFIISYIASVKNIFIKINNV